MFRKHSRRAHLYLTAKFTNRSVISMLGQFLHSDRKFSLDITLPENSK